MRTLLEAVGLQNIVAKSLGSNNAVNMVSAALEGLLNLKSQKTESEKRGVKLKLQSFAKGDVVAFKQGDKKEADEKKTVATSTSKDNRNEKSTKGEFKKEKKAAVQTKDDKIESSHVTKQAAAQEDVAIAAQDQAKDEISSANQDKGASQTEASQNEETPVQSNQENDKGDDK